MAYMNLMTSDNSYMLGTGSNDYYDTGTPSYFTSSGMPTVTYTIYIGINTGTENYTTVASAETYVPITDTLNNLFGGTTYSPETYQYVTSLGGCGYGEYSNPQTPKEAKRAALRFKIRTALRSKMVAHHLPTPSNDEEQRARKLLLSLIGQERYRLYLKRGFVVEQGKSGLKYKIKPGHSMVEVLHPKKSGEFFKFRSLCIQPKVSGLPPTDSVIMRIMLVRHDEFAMQKLSNITVLSTPSAEDERGVSDFLRERVA